VSGELTGRGDTSPLFARLAVLRVLGPVATRRGVGDERLWPARKSARLEALFASLWICLDRWLLFDGPDDVPCRVLSEFADVDPPIVCFDELSVGVT